METLLFVYCKNIFFLHKDSSISDIVDYLWIFLNLGIP